MEQRLRDLASGEWKGKDLSRRVGSKEQRKRMKVPIMEVSASATVSILWQVDIGFYDELPWVQQQIVKGKFLLSLHDVHIYANSYSVANCDIRRRGKLIDQILRVTCLK